MIGICCCVFCKEEKSVKGIHTHVDRAHLGINKYSSGFNGKYAELSAKKVTNEACYLTSPKKCAHCETALPYHKRFNTYCNSSCAALATSKTKDFTKFKTGPAKSEKPKVIKSCLQCQGLFETAKTKKRYCSVKCANIKKAQAAQLNKSAWQNYRRACQFKFSLREYPEYFDLALLKALGWYHPVKNPNGVSRDHKISCKEGFLRNLPPEHLSHPANCHVMVHRDNISKYTRSSLTYEELLKTIAQWPR